ncbi:MAG: 6-phosphogluconolactonase [Bacteroidota bacterium]
MPEHQLFNHADWANPRWENERIHVFGTSEALADAAARLLIGVAQSAVAMRGEFMLVLSGGSTPNAMYELLATRYVDDVPWDKTHLFWGDERFVPLDDEQSNFHAAHTHLISRVPIRPEHTHAVATGLASTSEAAHAYEQTITRVTGDRQPLFDLVFLGLGEDGHTASLFPGDDQADPSSSRLVQPIHGPEYRPPRDRVSLSATALSNTRCATFLVAGAGKREALKAVLARDASKPATLIRPKGMLIWYTDEAAAGQPG